MVTEHQTRDYRITYTRFFPKRRTDTAAARGQEGVPLCLEGWPPSLFPQAGRISLFSSIFFFFGKSKFVKPQNQTCIPSLMSFFHRHKHHCMTFWDRPTNLSVPSTFQTQKKPQKNPNKQTGEVTSLASFCLVLNRNTYFDMFAQRCVCVQKLSAYAWSVCECIQTQEGGGGVGRGPQN